MSKISVIIATYNTAATLRTAIDSVLSQRATERELLIIDGGSSDGTQEIIRSYTDAIAYWTSEPDAGVYDAWNKGIRAARGEWILFMGADDRMVSAEVLGQLLTSIREAERRGCRLVYSQIAVRSATTGKYAYLGEEWTSARRRFFAYCNIPHVGMLHHRNLFSEYGLFDTQFKIAGDYEFLMRVLRHEDAMYQPLLAFEMGNAGMSNDSQHETLIIWENIRAKLKNRRNPFHIGLFKVVAYRSLTRLRVLLRAIWPDRWASRG